MLRDPRPPVLYLRAFGDDQLKLWTATFGRPSLIERFTLRRFDTFEEVLARHLSRYGPVIAVNPPKTRLAPLGAARETIDSPDWQSVVAGLMARSSLIVLVAPPRKVTDGLRWELETVSAGGYWDKALIVVPPVRAEDLQRRWEEFQEEEGARLRPFTVPGRWRSANAGTGLQAPPVDGDRRGPADQWSYGAALRQAIASLRERAPAPPPWAPRPPGLPAPSRRTVRGGPLTLPVAALIVVLAAAVTGVGSWYALRSAPPAAHLSAVATPTLSPDSSPPTDPATVAGPYRPPRHLRPPARSRSPRRPPCTPARTRSSRLSSPTSRRSTAGTTPRT